MSVIITVRKGGRIVIPKSIRDSLGLREGTRLRLQCSAGKFEAIPEDDETTIEMRGGFPIIRGSPPRKQGDIVRAIKAGREDRAAQLLSYRSQDS